MGDIRKTRKKFASPSHPWERARIDQEKVITKNYALKNKKEIWRMTSKLKGFKQQAKTLSSLRTAQSEKEQALLQARLIRLGLLKPGAGLEEILTLRLEDLMERRLQTMLVKKGLARTMKQARQLITHGHIRLGETVVTAPSYFVLSGEEDKLSFHPNSTLADAEHPERKPVAKKEVKADTKKEEEIRKKGVEKAEDAPKGKKGKKKEDAEEEELTPVEDAE